MGLKATRIILCTILSFIIAVSSLVTMVAIVLNITMANPSYISQKIVTPQLVASCSEQLNMKFDALSAESGIPVRVFETVTDNSAVEFALRTAADNIFSQESSEMDNEERDDYFYKLCTEYLDGNNIDYNEDNVMRVSEKATQLYGETVGIHNIDSIEKYIAQYKQNCLKAISAGIVIIVVCCILISLVYKKKNEIYLVIASSAMGGGIGTVLSAIAGMILKLGSDIVFYPDIYQQSLYSMTKGCFAYLFIFGTVFTLISLIATIYSIKQIKKENFRQKTRYSKVIGR